MDMTAEPSSQPGESPRRRIRHLPARVVAYIARRLRSGRADWARRGEGGAVVLEFAIILPLLITITFGIIEYSDAYHDSAIASDAASAGGRVGSALATSPGSTSSI